MTIISDNGISKVWLDGGYIYKQQPKFLTDNEIWCLETLWPTGHVPAAKRINKELIELEYIEATPVTDLGILHSYFQDILIFLHRRYGIRHGDLTEKNIIIRYNKPYIIDFAESRLSCDPRLDKRPEGDEFWLKYTFEKLKHEHP